MLRWTDGVRREVLPNGLTLLTQEDPGCPAVAVVCQVCTGFFDEPDQVVGVSHVLEHMLFKGTPTRGVGEVAREAKAAGGYLNAGTGYDHTAYYAVLPNESLGVGLDLLADMLRRSVIDGDELRRELRVIVEEGKRKLDTPSAVAGETLNALLFDHHRIRRWRIGTEAQIEGLSRADVLGFYRSRYVPSRTIVAIAGGVSGELALRLARESFEGWEPAVSPMDPSPDEPRIREVRARTLQGDVRKAELVLGWRGVPPLDVAAAPLEVAATILGSGRASWLYQRLREPGIVSSIGAWHFAPTEVGVFGIDAELDGGALDAALSGVAACLARLREKGPGPGDLDRARVLLRARWAHRFESAEGRATALAGAEALGGIHLVDEMFEQVLAVDAESVRRAAEEWLDPGSVCGVAYLPSGSAELLDVPRLRNHFSRSEWSVPAEPVQPVVPQRAALVAPGTTSAGVLHIPLPHSDLLLVRKPGVPLVSLGVYRRRSVLDARATAGLGALAVRTAVRGAGEFDAGGLALAFERLGGSLSRHLGAEWFSYGATVLPERAAEAAALLRLVLEEPRYEEAETGREREVLLEEIARGADDMVGYPMQLAISGVFGEAGYGLPLEGLAASVPGLTSGMARAWHACELSEGRTTVVAAGDIDPERLGATLAGLFGSPPRREGNDVAMSNPWPTTRGEPVVVAEEREKRQTALAMLFPGPSRRHPDRDAAVVWSAIASGLGGRLFTALREARSLAYTVIAQAWQRLQAGGLILYIATSPEREEEARSALLEELDRFRTEPPSADELSRAINYVVGQRAVRRQTARALAGDLADAWLLGEGLDEFADPVVGIRRVTAEAVQRVAIEGFDPGRRAEGIVRGR
jgi:zinc protease